MPVMAPLTDPKIKQMSWALFCTKQYAKLGNSEEKYAQHNNCGVFTRFYVITSKTARLVNKCT